MYKILFIGDLNEYGRGYQRFISLQALGYTVKAFTHTKVSPIGTIEHPSLLYRIFWKLKIPFDVTDVNKNIISVVKKQNFEIIWIEKGNGIKPWTLWRIKKLTPNAKLISVSEDDMYATHGHSMWYRLGLKFYDVIFTTKEYNLSELKNFGACKTELFLDSYDQHTHKSFDLSNDEMKRFKCDVSAIGAYEKERADSLLYLAENGIKVVVWGGNWEPYENLHPNLMVKNEFLFGTDYSKAICASKINLNFLRKINRDEVTSRSVEIPACGAFMLTERTKRHCEFFKEKIEADFFDTNDELLTKVKYYLEHDEERERIAFAGKERCQKSGYSMHTQLENILSASKNIN